MKNIYIILSTFLLLSIALFANNARCLSLMERNNTNRYCEVSSGYDYPSFYTILKKILKQGKYIYNVEKVYLDDNPKNSDIKYSFRLKKNTHIVYLVIDEYHTDPFLVFAYTYSNNVLIDKEECSTQMTLDMTNPKESILYFKCANTKYTIYQKNRGVAISSISLQIKKGDNIELFRGELSTLRGDLRTISKVLNDDILKNLLIIQGLQLWNQEK